MWDLDTLHYMNEQAHLEAVERARQMPEAKPAVFPLAILARRLLVGPPSLSHLIDLFTNSESIKAFLDLVREYLPEHEAEIMAQDIDDRIQKFAAFFSQRYFPLADQIYWEIDLGDFVSYIPVDLRGFTYDDYHSFSDFRPGYILLLSLIIYPYWDGYDSTEEMRACSRGLLKRPVGGRVPIIEEVQRLVGAELAGLIPVNGWTPEALHQMTDGTDYEGYGEFADWVCSSTGCMQLDANMEEYSGEEWRRDLVEQLTEEWPKAREIQRKAMHLADWVEDDPKTNFRELLMFLLGRKDMIVPKEQLSLPLNENKEMTTSGENESRPPLREATRADIVASTRF